MDQGNSTGSRSAEKVTAHSSLPRERIHKFEDGEETITVETIELPNGEVIAFNNDDSDPLAFGHGFSTIGAIADLFEKLPAAQSEREERDLLVERWDHARDLRKHG